MNYYSIVIFFPFCFCVVCNIFLAYNWVTLITSVFNHMLHSACNSISTLFKPKREGCLLLRISRLLSLTDAIIYKYLLLQHTTLTNALHRYYLSHYRYIFVHFCRCVLTLGEQQLAVRLKIYFVDVTVLTQYLLQDIDEVLINWAHINSTPLHSSIGESRCWKQFYSVCFNL